LSAREHDRRPASLPDDVAEEVADAMFALSTPSRVQILACLLSGGKAVKELTQALGMEQSAVSHQLRVLRDHRLLTVEQVGRTRVYALYDQDVVAFVEGALRHVEGRRSKGRRLSSRLRRTSA
jgi:DNA-binding transcriptional ArsR family regulator